MKQQNFIPARALFLVLAVCIPLSAQKPDSRIPRVLERHIQTMVELADWCEVNGLLRERHRVLECVIDFDPQHQRARALTGWQRLGSRNWERVKGFRRPSRTNGEMGEEWKKRADALCDSYVRKAAPRLKRLKNPSLAVSEWRRLARAMQVIAPRHEGLRMLLGEVKVKRRWILKESAGTRERRRELASRAKLLLSGAGDPATVALSAAERKVELPWKDPVFLPGVRVVGTVSDHEIAEACRLSRATIMYVRLSMKAQVRPFQNFTIYLLASREEARRFLHFFPGVSDADRRFAEGLSSCWLSGTSRVLIWPEVEKKRQEWVARQTVAMLLRSGWNITTAQGAVFEGLGLYISHKVCGQRSTWYVRPTRYGRRGTGKNEAELLKKTRHWMRLARRRIQSDPPNYRRLLGLNVNQMRTEDLLDSYVFSAWLLEGVTREQDAFLKLLGRGKSFEKAVFKVWGMDSLELQGRVLRWLKETQVP